MGNLTSFCSSVSAPIIKTPPCVFAKDDTILADVCNLPLIFYAYTFGPFAAKIFNIFKCNVVFGFCKQHFYVLHFVSLKSTPRASLFCLMDRAAFSENPSGFRASMVTVTLISPPSFCIVRMISSRSRLMSSRDISPCSVFVATK